MNLRSTFALASLIGTLATLSAPGSGLGHRLQPSQAEYNIERQDADSIDANSAVGSGEVRPNRYIKVTSDAPGRLQRLYVTPGDEVRKGQALFLIESASNLRQSVRKYSPLTGIVADISARVGETVSGSSLDPPVMIIADMSRIYVEVNVDGRDISKVAVGQRARIIVDAFHKDDIRGLVIRKDTHPIAQSKDPEFRVMIEIRKISKAIRKRVRPGMSATAYITITRKSDLKR